MPIDFYLPKQITFLLEKKLQNSNIFPAFISGSNLNYVKAAPFQGIILTSQG